MSKLPARCALCGVKERAKGTNNYFCDECCKGWHQSPDVVDWDNPRIDEARQAFVRRVRFTQCKRAGHFLGTPTCYQQDPVDRELGTCSFDCHGCTAYAPRDKQLKKDCFSCAHGVPGECFLMNGQCEYIPRACGNCEYHNDEEDECNYDDTCHLFDQWQPRPVGTEYCKDCQRWSKDDAGECLVDKQIKAPLELACGNFKPRPAEPPQQPCGKCGHYTEDATVKRLGELQEGTCSQYHMQTNPKHIPPYCDKFMAKSCSICGHFHAEPRDTYIGYCTAVSTWEHHGIFGNHCTGVGKDDASHCSEFTPRAAPPMNKCTKCGKETQLSGGLCNDHKEAQSNLDFRIQENAIKRLKAGETSTPPAACARCGITATYKYKDRDEKIWDLCEDCRQAIVRSKHTSIIEDKSKESAAGRPWQIDRLCGNCGKFTKESHGGYDGTCTYTGCGVNEKGLSGAGCFHFILKTPAAAPVEIDIIPFRWSINIDEEQNFTLYGKVDCLGKTLEMLHEINGKKCSLKIKESDAKMAFKCQQCGYEDETRKKVVYCPRCGAAVEQNEDKNLRLKIASLEQEKTGFQGVVDCLNLDKERLHFKNLELEREKGDLARAVSKLEYERDNARQDFDREWKKSQSAEETIQSLRRRGVPWTVRRAMKKMYAHANFSNGDCCGIFNQVGTDNRNVKCNECGLEYSSKELERLFNPAKPAPLWKVKWEERKSWRAWKKAEKQEVRVKTRQTSIEDAARYKRYAEEIKKKLEGAA